MGLNAFQSPIMKRTSFFGVSSKRSCRSLEPFSFSFFGVTGWGIDLDYCDTEWFALETNRDHSVVFEIASKYFMGNRWGNSGNRVKLCFLGAPKSLQMVIAAMKLKDAYSLEGKL